MGASLRRGAESRAEQSRAAWSSSYDSAMTYSAVLDLNGQQSLSFECGELPADGAVRAAGHEPNGYFWEGAVAHIAPDLLPELVLDSEAGMFSASGPGEVLKRLQNVLEPILGSPDAIKAVIERAESDGFAFDG